MNGNSGRVNTDSGKMNSDSGHGAKSWYFPPEYAFTQNQKQRSRSARIPGHAGPEYAIGKPHMSVAGFITGINEAALRKKLGELLSEISKG